MEFTEFKRVLTQFLNGRAMACAPIGSPSRVPPGSPVKIPQIESSPKVPQICKNAPRVSLKFVFEFL